MRLNLLKCAKAKRKGSEISKKECKIVENCRGGVWLVPILQNSLHVVDHGISVNEYKAFILDSAEEFPIKFGPQSLRIRGI